MFEFKAGQTNGIYNKMCKLMDNVTFYICKYITLIRKYIIKN